ncbi:MAG: GDSL-type esterase/lipase family protein [Verrucomicrobiia bacterium]
MRLPLLPVSIVSLLSWTYAAPQAAGQSLSIVKEGDTGLLIKASAPASERHVLQASKDLNLWLDLDDAVSGTVSIPVPTTKAAQCYFRLVPWAEPAPIQIVLIGDSTVADQASNLGRFCGWGQGLYVYFKPNARVINLAYPGVSTKTFLYSDQKASMLAIKPDYVLIDLFYVDEFNGPPEITTTLEEFEANLRIIVEMIRGFGGTPILLTPQCLYVFNESGKTGPAYPKRIAVVAQLAAELGVYLIDLSTLSVNLLNQLGEENSQPLFMDWLHFSNEGAEVISGLVVNALPSELGPYLVAEKTLGF